ncbi:MAG: lipoprotein bor [Methylobacter sp.]|nr:MAG: lipoprotein bor [Methylobacter sp.]
MKQITLFMAIALVSTGCATQSFQINQNATASSVPTKEIRQPFFVRGVGQTRITSAAEICGGASNIAKVEAEETFLDGFFEMVTIGIYSPRVARVYCAK